MPKRTISKTTKKSTVAAAAAKSPSKKKQTAAAKSPSNKKVTVAAAAAKSPFKKKLLSLKPPSPSAHNHIDTVSRMNIERSASGYSLGWATKGPPSSSGKPYTKPLEEKVSDSNDLKLNTYINCYGLAKRKATGCSNEAKQYIWHTSDGEKKWNDWKVSYQ